MELFIFSFGILGSLIIAATLSALLDPFKEDAELQDELDELDWGLSKEDDDSESVF